MIPPSSSIIHIPPPEDEPCEQCGLCCRISDPDITPTAANAHVWLGQGRTGILRWSVASIERGTQVSCTSLNAGDPVSAVRCGSPDPRQV